MSHAYCLITPCRNEAEYARRALDSVLAQTKLPSLWVIVDDGSSDETPAILAEYAARHDWLRIVRREDRGRRAVGPGVIEAFYAGYDTIDPADSRWWVASALHSWRSHPPREGKKRPAIDAW